VRPPTCNTKGRPRFKKTTAGVPLPRPLRHRDAPLLNVVTERRASAVFHSALHTTRTWLPVDSAIPVGPRNPLLSLTLPVMERNTLKLLGVTLRGAMPLEDNKNSKDFRRLIVQLERRQRELNSKRDEPDEREPH
jgi:hypothetical protein